MAKAKQVALRYDARKRACLLEIEALRGVLDSLYIRIREDDGILNVLGELQGLPGRLDCQITELAILRALKNGAITD